MTITILHAREGNFRKSFHYEGSALKATTPRLPLRFLVEKREVSALEELSSILSQLEKDRERFIVRGLVAEGVDTNQPLYRRKADGLRAPQEAPFEDKPIDWLMLDIDKQTLPTSIDLLTQPVQAIEHLIQQLPKEFHNSSVHYQLSGSAGIWDSKKVSAHLVFWLANPATSAQLKKWATAVNTESKLIDSALFNPVQPHYTAKPGFPAGYKDPFAGCRSGLIRKTCAEVKIDFNIVETVKHHSKAAPQQHFEGVSGYDNILSELGDGVGGQGFHFPLLRGVASHVSISGRERAEATREALKTDLRERIDAADQTNHSDQEIARYKSDDILDKLINSAIAKYGDAKACPPYFNVVELPVEEAEKKLNQTIDEFSEKFHDYWQSGVMNFVDPPCLAIKATAGLGKTSKLIARLIQHNALELGDIHYFVPTHKLSQQLITDLDAALNIELESCIFSKSQLIAGRDKTDDKNVPLCEKAELAKEVAKLGLPVSTTLCKNSSSVCSSYSTCGYQKQFGDKELEQAEEASNPRFNEVFSEVKVMAHSHLFLNTKGRMRSPKLVIIDEAFWQTGIDEQLIDPADLITVGQPISAFICTTLLKPESPPLLKALRDAGHDENSLKAEADEIEKVAAVKVDIKPSMTAPEQMKRLESSTYIVKAHTLLRHLAAEMTKVERDNSHVVRYEPKSNDKNPKAGKLVLTIRKHLNIDSATPIIFIDANAQKQVLEQFVASVDVVEIAAQRKATIHQFTDKTFSKTMLLKADSELLGQVKTFIAGVASKGSTLVACSKAVMVAVCGKGDTFEGASFVNFGNLRGLNDYSSFDNVIILGREQPAANSLSDQARSMWFDSEEPLRVLPDKGGNQPYSSQARGYRGVQRGSVQVQVHPDWRAKLLLEQIREAESEQALDRLRLLRGKGKQRQVYILSNVPLNVTVDQLWSWKQYQKSLEVLRACDWQIPKKTRELMELLPDISERTARDWLKELKTAESLIINTIKESAVF